MSADAKTAANATGPIGLSHRPGSDLPFLACFMALAGAYILLIVAMVLSEFVFVTPVDVWNVLSDKEHDEIRYATVLTLVSCTISATLSVLIAVPIGYLFSRFRFPFKGLLDAFMDIPIVLPPLVVGICLLILFNRTALGIWAEDAFMFVWELLHIDDFLGLFGVHKVRGITYDLPAVILAQFAVACAFAVRTMRVTFSQIDHRCEQVALTLGARRSQSFFRVVMPEARHGMIAAGTLAWARSMGEFGPILVFAGTTRLKTEVLSSSVFLEFTNGQLENAVAVSLLMVTLAMIVLGVTRLFGLRGTVY